MLVAKSCLTLCNLMGCRPPGSSVHGISQARILEWVATSFSRDSSQTRNRTQVSCNDRQIRYHWATGEAPATWFPTLAPGPEICAIKGAWLSQQLLKYTVRPYLPDLSALSPGVVTAKVSAQVSTKKCLVCWSLLCIVDGNLIGFLSYEFGGLSPG